MRVKRTIPKPTQLPCGCVHDHRTWIKLCSDHGGAEAELHNRAMREHIKPEEKREHE